MRKPNHKPGVDKLDTPENLQKAIEIAASQGFKPVLPAKTETKHVYFHGIKVKIDRTYLENQVKYSAEIPENRDPELDDERITYQYYSRPWTRDASVVASIEDEAVAHDAIMAWACKNAKEVTMQRDLAGALAGKPDHVIDGVLEDGLRKVVGNLVRIVWECPHDDNGERGLIECLEIDEQDISVDITGCNPEYEMPVTEYILHIIRDDSQYTSELEVKAELIRLLGPADTGDKWVAFFRLSEV